MAEGRMLKKVICESPKLAALKNDTHRLIYTWLIPHLDIEGRHHADPRIVKSHVAPILDHITTKVIIAALNDMAKNDLIVLYSVNGKEYLELQLFKKHQFLRPDREKQSEIPAPGVVQEDSGSTDGELLNKYKYKFKYNNNIIPKKTLVADAPLDDFVPEKEWNEFVAMRARIKKPLTDYAKKLIIAKLKRLRGDPKAILNQSIENSWAGVFELKEERQYGQGFKRDFRPGDVELPREDREEIERVRREREHRLRNKGVNKPTADPN